MNRFCSFLAISLFSSSLVLAQGVTLRVVDQSGTELTGSAITVQGVGTFVTGSTVSLLAGTYDVILDPAIGGHPAVLGLLRRTESFTLTAGQSLVEFTWETKTVAIDIVDQHGASLPGSSVRFISIPGSSRSTPTSIQLPITDPAVYPHAHGPYSEGPGQFGYDLTLVPGIDGVFIDAFLYRTEGTGALGSSPVAVDSSTSSLIFEWKTRSVTFDVHSAPGVPIDGSAIVMLGVPGPMFGRFPLPATLVLPINDEAVYPHAAAAHAGRNNGYLMDVFPGVLGQAQSRNGSFLVRQVGSDGPNPSPESVIISEQTSSVVFPWIVSPVTFDIQDQNGATIPGSEVEIVQLIQFGVQRVSVPFLVELPVNDPSLYPSIRGSAALSEGQQGYDVIYTPGIDGNEQVGFQTSTELYQYHGLSGGDLSVGVFPETSSVVVTWPVIHCPPVVFDELGIAVPGSQLGLPAPFSPFALGRSILFPITDNGAIPAISGVYANGYPILVQPGDIVPSSATFDFEFGVDGILSPESVVVGGNRYRVSCFVNRAPSADAGPNLTVVSSQVATTSVLGSAFDEDGDALLYRWLNGAVELAGWQATGAQGEAVLDLGLAPVFSLGSHVLTLEVTDGQRSASDTMTLTVGNSAPTVSCNGAGTYQAGVDVVQLSGTVADFDGDSLTYAWLKGATVLASGTVPSTAGGTPVSLPPLTLTTGSQGVLGLGSHALTLEVSDGNHAASRCDAIVTVVDTEVPRLAPVSDCDILLPPNHRMVPVTIQVNAQDSSGSPVVISATVASSEDPDKDGDGHTIPDVTAPVIDQVQGTIYLELRAERSGRGSGRTYTITITATDASGNQSQALVECVAPHDRSGH